MKVSLADVLLNPQALAAYYQSDPLRDAVDVLSVKLERFLTLILSPLATADHIPEKWRSQGVNAFLIVLDCYEVLELNIQGWSPSVRGVVSVERQDGGMIRISLETPECTLHYNCTSVYLQRITGLVER